MMWLGRVWRMIFIYKLKPLEDTFFIDSFDCIYKTLQTILIILKHK